MLAEKLAAAALVVAHPDDEILWFSSVLNQVSQVYVCYLDVPGREDWTQGRRYVAGHFPLENVTFLGLVEAVTYRSADWSAPVENAWGLELGRQPGTPPEFSKERYHSNFKALVDLLSEKLVGVDTVITHNPWGEYGNEEHVQVYRAVREVSGRLGYDVWYSNYCGDRSYPLMMTMIDGRRSDCETRSTDPGLARSIEALYREHDCWTWPFDDYTYFAEEAFIRDREPPGTVPGAPGLYATSELHKAC